MVFLVIAWIASVFTFIYSFYFVFNTFAGKRKQKALPVKPKEAPKGMLVAPVILAVFVVVIFIVPNMVGDVLVKPAVVAMQMGLYRAPSEVLVQVAAWHGFTPEFWMTFGIIVSGVLLYLTLAKWQKVYNLQPKSFSLNAAYDALMSFGEKTMNKLSRLYMTGILRTYLVYMFGAIVVIVLATLFAKDAFTLNASDLSPVNWYGLLTAVILTISVCMLLFAKKRMYSIVALGGVGYSVALLFIIYKAPDLALTQLVIES